MASTAPGRAAASASRTQIRSFSWLTPTSLATEAYVPPGLTWYSATASARNSGEYFDVPNGNSCPMDPHDPMIRVSTIKGQRPVRLPLGSGWRLRRRPAARERRASPHLARATGWAERGLLTQHGGRGSMYGRGRADHDGDHGVCVSIVTVVGLWWSVVGGRVGAGGFPQGQQHPFFDLGD